MNSRPSLNRFSPRVLGHTSVAAASLAMALIAAPAFAQDAGSAPTNGSVAPGAGVPVTGSTLTAGDDANTAVQDVVVTGSRISRPDLVAQSPVIAVTSEQVRLSGQTRIEDVINQLPQLSVSQSSSVSNGSDGTATANLRNLGDTRTLVLVNGLRLPPGDPSRNAGSVLGSAADLNNIPALLVKRVDVLTGGASAVYGADAVAGVVNFILDEEFTGLKIDGQSSLADHNNNNTVARSIISADPRYTSTTNPLLLPRDHDYDGGSYTVSAVAGAKFGTDGAGHVSLFGVYHRQEPVLLASRDYANCPIASNELDNGPGAASSSKLTDYYCSGSSNTAQTSLLINGGSGGGLGNGPGTRLILTPGSGIRTYDDAADPYSFNATNYFQRPDTRINAGGFLSYDFSEHAKAYFNGLFMDDHSLAQIAPSGTFNNVFTLNCSNPLLSTIQATTFGCVAPGPGNLQTVNVALAKRNVEGGARFDDLRHTDYRIVAGLRGKINEIFSYDAHYQYGATIYRERYLNDLSRARVANALNNCLTPAGASIGDAACVPYNIFTGTTTLQANTAAGVTQGAINYVSTPGRKNAAIREQVAGGTIQADLGAMGVQSPFASKGISLAFGPEWRRESLALVTDNEFATGDLLGQGGQTKSSSGSFTVTEGFIEAGVPLVSDRPFVQDLTFDGAYRFSHYSSVGNTNTWKLSLSWSPFGGNLEGALRFRGSINRAVRAPTIQDFFAPSQLGLGGSSDTCAQRSAGRQSSGTLAACLRTAQSDPNFAAQFANGFGIARNPASQYNSITAGAVTAGSTLRPETAITKTFGFVIEPRAFLPHFSATVDYYDINLKDRIGTDGYGTIFNQCYNTGSTYYCGLIHRDPANGSLWLTPNGYISDPVYNTGHLKTNGVDVSAQYSTGLGRFGKLALAFNGTRLLHLKTEVTLHQPNGSIASNGYYDCVGYYDDGSFCGVPNPKWRHSLRATYNLVEPITLSLNWRHIGQSYSQYANNDLGADGTALIGGYAKADLPNSRIPAYDYLDAVIAIRPAHTNFEFRIGVNNVADRDPPLIPGAEYNVGNLNGNTVGGLYDNLGRTLFAGVSAKF